MSKYPQNPPIAKTTDKLKTRATVDLKESLSHWGNCSTFKPQGNWSFFGAGP